MSAIAGRTAALVIGGRRSPEKPNPLMFILKMDAAASSKGCWSQVQLHSQSSFMEPRWRHTANVIDFHGI